ncbi:MAG TPA: exodeoxyribonuclease VII small subunit [Halanaerobiaceae bacterium]|nr:exodeoxyribonuclease VII small subunit [Bacillota bacterium]HHU92929.1 exodeoxyribonuclease VII small subunit [Halanaerobiaceae bacterium]HOA41109.1 exodeoxyribonuclease VII small subunit [Halanaerobiales bacterium]HPZ63388.1 exodeoxyribonuclease VII small subunit [Halanaerobiales bacterium]HQD03928.1 exodeoxyribonuclease VII small subunit [Halanaerobiales bacterium]
MTEKKINFEDALARLEEVVKELEDGGLSLEKSLELFEEGVRLVKFCKLELDQAEKKIEIVLKKDEDYNEVEVVPFNVEEEN